MLLTTLDLPALRAAWRTVRRSPRPGRDGVGRNTFEATLEMRLRRLLHDVRAGRYRPGPLLRVPRPKRRGVRWLAVPTYTDRVLQTAVLRAVQPTLDRRLRPEVHGYRPRRSPATAVRHLVRQVGRHEILEVVCTDIASLFDTLDARGLSTVLAEACVDPLWQALTGAWLHTWAIGGRGIPQGAPLSPLFANLYLARHVDRWIPRAGGGLPCGDRLAGWIRYGDDFTLVVPRRGASWRAAAWLGGVVRGAGLALSDRKTVLWAGGALAAGGIDVLGQRLSLVPDRGRWRLERVTASARRRAPP